MAKKKSIEEKIEEIGKRQLDDGKVIHFTKNENINVEIEDALKKALSKSGGLGGNMPDIKVFISTKTMRKIPVVIEVKGTAGDLVKLSKDGQIDNYNKKNEPNYRNISKYAVNGAIHYANAIITNTLSYKEVVAIGMNGYYSGTDIVTEYGVYYVSAENFCIPKEIGNYSDLSFLYEENIDQFIESIDSLSLTEEEIEQKSKEYENEIEDKLKTLNQTMEDDLQIGVGSRVELVAGMIMAGLGVENKVAPLDVCDLKGETGQRNNDGRKIIDKISDFLAEKNLPDEKREMIVNDLSRVFIYSDLWKPIEIKNDDGTRLKTESKLKSIYSIVSRDIMPIFTSAKHLDFTGKLFNVLNEWVDIPDSAKNDVVLTPRYVTELMAKLAQVNMNSYVWDYAAGSGGFLVSSMKLMIKDAESRINSPTELKKKIREIKEQHLLGIEKRSDIYLLAVLNMILMGDGSSNIVHKDSLRDYEGTYEQGKLKGKPFPANVFLLNPPYSAEGKGMIFVEKALKQMSNGRAVILIQENAGSGNGLPYSKNILNNNTLVASIHMSDIFCGKAGVQTAIYVFDIGIPHNEKKNVKFINFSNDGYTRQNRKRSSANANLKNTDHAIERYDEIVDLVLYGNSQTNYYSGEDYIEEPITLNGDDWTFMKHAKFDIVPKEEDFKDTINSYLGWKLSSVLKEGKR